MAAQDKMVEKVQEGKKTKKNEVLNSIMKSSNNYLFNNGFILIHY